MYRKVLIAPHPLLTLGQTNDYLLWSNRQFLNCNSNCIVHRVCYCWCNRYLKTLTHALCTERTFRIYGVCKAHHNLRNFSRCWHHIIQEARIHRSPPLERPVLVQRHAHSTHNGTLSLPLYTHRVQYAPAAGTSFLTLSFFFRALRADILHGLRKRQQIPIDLDPRELSVDYAIVKHGASLLTGVTADTEVPPGRDIGNPLRHWHILHAPP